MIIYYQPSSDYIWDYDGCSLFNGKEVIMKNQVELNMLIRHGILTRIGKL